MHHGETKPGNDLDQRGRRETGAYGLEAVSTLAVCVTQTVQRYIHEASDEEGVTLIAMLDRSPDPGHDLPQARRRVCAARLARVAKFLDLVVGHKP
jgi:hypothetical protein